MEKMNGIGQQTKPAKDCAVGIGNYEDGNKKTPKQTRYPGMIVGLSDIEEAVVPIRLLLRKEAKAT